MSLHLDGDTPFSLAAADRRFENQTCFYFASEQPPIPGPDLALNGEGRGLINSLIVPSNLSDYYAPAGQHLVTVNLLDVRGDPDLVEPQLCKELIGWFGAEARR